MKKRCGSGSSWNLENYQNYGFGLWAVTLKEENRLIGDCGMAMQCVHGKMLPEIGYQHSSGLPAPGLCFRSGEPMPAVCL